ncbi:MAG: hypothetical protein KF888_04075 [Nitrosomonas sp.]|nr:hypothetical protein [Nitrosomonas sp.]
MSGTRIRQKFAKKRSLHGVNEHFSQIFNAIIVPRSSRAKVSNSSEQQCCITGIAAVLPSQNSVQRASVHVCLSICFIIPLLTIIHHLIRRLRPGLARSISFTQLIIMIIIPVPILACNVAAKIFSWTESSHVWI